MSTEGWDHFWKEQKQSFNSIMVVNTYFFGSQIEKLYQLKPSDDILDYGCGPGLLIDYLKRKDIVVTGADINKSFIEQCRENHPEGLFIPITTDIGENEKILKMNLQKKQFDFIVLLSIAQYFENTDALSDLTGILTPYLEANGKIIIADVIHPQTSAIKDTWSLFIQCIKTRKIISFIQFIFYLIFSNYRKISKAAPLLILSEESIKAIANKYHLTCDRVDGLTIHSSRTNYVLSKTM